MPIHPGALCRDEWDRTNSSLRFNFPLFPRSLLSDPNPDAFTAPFSSLSDFQPVYPVTVQPHQLMKQLRRGIRLEHGQRFPGNTLSFQPRRARIPLLR